MWEHARFCQINQNKAISGKVIYRRNNSALWRVQLKNTLSQNFKKSGINTYTWYFGMCDTSSERLEFSIAVTERVYSCGIYSQTYSHVFLASPFQSRICICTISVL